MDGYPGSIQSGRGDDFSGGGGLVAVRVGAVDPQVRPAARANASFPSPTPWIMQKPAETFVWSRIVRASGSADALAGAGAGPVVLATGASPGAKQMILPVCVPATSRPSTTASARASPSTLADQRISPERRSKIVTMFSPPTTTLEPATITWNALFSKGTSQTVLIEPSGPGPSLLALAGALPSAAAGAAGAAGGCLGGRSSYAPTLPPPIA